MSEAEEVYCALCGVPFEVDEGVYRTDSVLHHDIAWTQYYTARKYVLCHIEKARISDSSSSKEDEIRETLRLISIWHRPHFRMNKPCLNRVRLRCKETDGMAEWTRLWLRCGIYQCEQVITFVDSHARWYPINPTSTESYSGDLREILYPMHPPCWKIFLESHARLATRDSLHPDLFKLTKVFAAQDLEEGYRGLVPSWTDDYNGSERFWSDGWSYHFESESFVVIELLKVAPEWDFLVHDSDNA